MKNAHRITSRSRAVLPVLVIVLSGQIAPPLLAQSPPPSYGIDFVTISNPGNPACSLVDPGGTSLTHGRGSVPYEYRIGRLETTTAQWMGFVNTYSVLGGSWTYFANPVFWGAEVDPAYSGPGQRYHLSSLPDAANIPVSGLSWREAAMYCNWLHNGKATGVSALANGAYDASTFTTNPNQTFNDQRTHNPDARFWIPTLDEWIKAAHYDPNRHGPSQGGWWMYPNASNTPLVYGPPGAGQANSAFQLPAFGQFDIPLGSYPNVTSPWGLLDAAGAAPEWTEETSGSILGPEARIYEGSGAGWDFYSAELDDRVTQFGAMRPWIAGNGIRIASAVPAPGMPALLAMISCSILRRKRKGERCGGWPEPK